MHTAEVVVSKPERYSRRMILDLLGESVRQARESGHLHSHGQVLSFDLRSANVFRVGSPFRTLDNLIHFTDADCILRYFDLDDSSSNSGAGAGNAGAANGMSGLSCGLST
jgi:hypothetical protein